MSKQPTPSEIEAAESRTADAVTVAWMLSVMTTLVCSIVALLVWLAVRNEIGAEGPKLFAAFMHFSAVVTAVLSLVFAAVVYRVRRDRPPTSITVASVAIALVPIVAAFL